MWIGKEKNSFSFDQILLKIRSKHKTFIISHKTTRERCLTTIEDKLETVTSQLQVAVLAALQVQTNPSFRLASLLLTKLLDMRVSGKIIDNNRTLLIKDFNKL
jgi:hypothetical protein